TRSVRRSWLSNPLFSGIYIMTGPVESPPIPIARREHPHKCRRLEPDEDAADDAFGRPDDEELVIHRARIAGIAEEVAQADEHFPSGRAGERHERQRLVHL